MKEFTRCRKDSTTPNELLSFYSVWVLIAESLPIYDAWLLSTTCKTLHTFLNKELPKNILAIERSKFTRRCCRCSGTPAYKHKLHPLEPYTCYLCNTKVAEFRVVSASVAVKEFGVRKTAVEKISRRIILDGHWGAYYAYLLTDVLALPPSDSITRRPSKAQERRAALVAALSTLGLILREDSRLCDSYISGLTSRDPKFAGLDNDAVLARIVERMAEMKMLHEYWDYKKIREHVVNASTGWMPREEFEAEIEYIAHKRYGPYPSVWPWMVK